MSKQWLLVAILFFASLTSNVSAADGDDYRCSIERVETARALDSSFHQAFVGREFTVERASGVMAGALKNSYVVPPELIDPGSSDSSYKVLGALKPGEGSGPGSNVYLLTVNEYDGSERKPFFFAQNDAAFFGYCTHF